MFYNHGYPDGHNKMAALHDEIARLRERNAEMLAALEDIASRVDEGTELGLKIKACAVIARIRANE